MNRRSFFIAGVATFGAALGLPFGLRAASNPLAGFANGAVVPLSAVRRLIAERTDAVLGRCRYVADLGIRHVAQPILFARRGEWLRAVLENRLPQPTTVHFHGLALPEAQDGAGFDPIAPGETKSLRFEIRNRSGLYWFHPHPHGFTAEQVYAGLAGLLVVVDEEDEVLDSALALAPGNRLALAVADVRIVSGMIRPYAPSAEDCLAGWLGDRAMANGVIDAQFAVAPGWVRLQLLNACNARGLLLAFREGERAMPFHLLGTDGGLLSGPRTLDRVFLHPAERVDLAIDARAHPRLDVFSLEFDPRLHTQGAVPVHRHPARGRFAPLSAEDVCVQRNSPGTNLPLPEGAPFRLFSLTVSGPERPARPLPQRLSSLPEAVFPPQVPVRRVRLDFSERHGFLIDGTPYDPDEIAFSVQRGAREVWELRNSPISMPHPMHLHGFGFRVLRRQGTFGPARALATESGGRLPTDLGVKDTAVIWPNETVWLAVDFTLPEDAAFRGRQRYMFHCHNLEHEDGMMMRNFAVL